MKYDIETREDVELLIDTFYDKIKEDDTIGYFFSEVAAVNWDKHLPIMYDFWSSILINEGRYQGGLIMKHILLDQKSRIEAHHLERWQFLFNQTLDELFEGEVVEDARNRVESMGQLMLFKVGKSRGPGFIQ